MPGLRPALLLDRDGIINHDTGFVHRIADFRFVDGIFELAADFAARGFLLVVVTNQSGIGRGIFSEKDFGVLTAWMKAQFAAAGIPIAAVYHCPDHPTEGKGVYRRESDRRKPRPGMLLQAANELGLDLAASWCLGDKMRDIEAGRAAQVGTLVLLDGMARSVERRADYWVVPRLADVRTLLAGRA